MRHLVSIARGIALFLSLFTLLNILGDCFAPGFDSNIWWIDLGRGGPISRAGHVALALSAAALLGFAVHPPASTTPRRFVQVALGFLLAVTLGNAIVFYILTARGRIDPGIPFPLSLMIAISLGLILIASLSKTPTPRSNVIFPMTFIACLILFPIAQMYCFGKTDYCRQADAIVVYGALAYPDGTPSQALADRVNTAIDLYHGGYARVLIFTGGPTKGPLSEPEVMRNVAMSRGVPESAIILDDAGLNTDKSVTNTAGIFQQHDLRVILAVSHFYHMPRIKMTYARELENGKRPFQVYTVPCKESRLLMAMPYFMAREIAALYAYYLRPLYRR